MPAEWPQVDPTLADDAILNADETKTGWKRRAVGTSKAKALDQIPRVGQLLTQIPIEPLRILQAHIRDRHINQARWLRTAIANQYRAEGGNPDTAEALQAMRVDMRRTDVPRDQYGQDRTRVGRKH